MIILGVDPGATGAAVALLCVDWKIESSKAVDWSAIQSAPNLSESLTFGVPRAYTFIEEQRSFAKGGRTMGAKSAFSLGENYGWWMGALAQYGCEVNVVRVADWQRYHFGSGTTISDPKVRSMRAAAAKLPGFSLDGKHGRADALLIALYGLAVIKKREG